MKADVTKFHDDPLQSAQIEQNRDTESEEVDDREGSERKYIC